MIYAERHFYKVCKPVNVGGIDRQVVINQKVRVVFFERAEMWSAPEVIGPGQFSWSDLRRHIIRKLTAGEKAVVRSLYAPQRHVDLTPKSASEAFG